MILLQVKRIDAHLLYSTISETNALHVFKRSTPYSYTGVQLRVLRPPKKAHFPDYRTRRNDTFPKKYNKDTTRNLLHLLISPQIV